LEEKAIWEPSGDCGSIWSTTRRLPETGLGYSRWIAMRDDIRTA
jgi:hypothetical protein